ncbi:MAG: NAD-dependent dehydratase, partial [Balneolaceae bacterium]
PNPPTGKEWVEKIAAEMGVKPKYRVATKSVMAVMGMFMPVMRESREMLYQYDRDYVFSSGKFEKRFGIKPTPYEAGIKEVLKSLETI